MEQTAAAIGEGGVPKGAQTHQYYRTEDIPPRFNNPDPRRKIFNNPGNPVATCPYPSDVQLPSGTGSSQPPPRADWFQGYGGKNQHPMYRTSANTYGGKQPSVHTMPTQFHAKSQKFSEHLGQCGMYRNYSLNTESDKSKV